MARRDKLSHLEACGCRGAFVSPPLMIALEVGLYYAAPCGSHPLLQPMYISVKSRATSCDRGHCRGCLPLALMASR